MYRLSPMCQEKEEILQHILSLKQCKVIMAQFSEEECFLIVFAGVRRTPIASFLFGFLCKLDKTYQETKSTFSCNIT